MSMLAAQSDELRKMAAAMSERGSAIGLDYGMGLGLVDAARMMREAADTITSLSDKLQGVIGTRYSELFGTPERAARTMIEMCRNSNGGSCAGCPILGSDVDDCSDINELLEWLKGAGDGKQRREGLPQEFRQGRAEGGCGMSMKQTMCEFVHGMTCEEVSRFVGSIVRCRDCKEYIERKGYTTCGYFGGDYVEIEPDGFCAWGERKVVGE